MLVGVTIVLLLIMGTVSAYLVTSRTDAQTASNDVRLNGAASLLAKDPLLAQNASPAGYAAVEIPLRRQPSVVPLTSGTLTSQLSAAVTQWLKSPSVSQVLALAEAGHLARAAGLLGSSGCQVFPRAGCKPVELAPGLEAVSRWVPAFLDGVPVPDGRAILFVGQSVSSSSDQVRGFVIAELITGTALIVLLALGGEWLIGRGLEPLDEMTKTANEITTRGDLTARMPDADDQTEVGRLGASINTMLDRIQHAFTSRLRSEQKVREFAADASHELRTPLTTIRGYAELYRQGALGPDELPNAMRRIEQESERMSMLVAELLELARLDRTTSLDLAETDLASLVRDAVADAVAVEPERPVRAETPPRLVAVVDEARIRQVLANLLGNVREHTPARTPAVVRLGEIPGGVLIEVADAGPGMAPEDTARAFDRFHRAAERPAGPAAADWSSARTNPVTDGNEADRATLPHRVPVAPGLGAAAVGESDSAGRESGQGRSGSRRVAGHSVPPERGERTSGSGLGLSIVQAIATAHGGRATLESVPGSGTRVRVWLPVRAVG